jgi:hypothetical protein
VDNVLSALGEEERESMSDHAKELPSEVGELARLFQAGLKRPSDYHAAGELMFRLSQNPQFATPGSHWRRKVAKAVGQPDALLDQCLQFRQLYPTGRLGELEEWCVSWDRLAATFAISDQAERHALLIQSVQEGWDDQRFGEEVKAWKGRTPKASSERPVTMEPVVDDRGPEANRHPVTDNNSPTKAEGYPADAVLAGVETQLIIRHAILTLRGINHPDREESLARLRGRLEKHIKLVQELEATLPGGAGSWRIDPLYAFALQAAVISGRWEDLQALVGFLHRTGQRREARKLRRLRVGDWKGVWRLLLRRSSQGGSARAA